MQDSNFISDVSIFVSEIMINLSWLWIQIIIADISENILIMKGLLNNCYNLNLINFIQIYMKLNLLVEHTQILNCCFYNK